MSAGQFQSVATRRYRPSRGGQTLAARPLGVGRAGRSRPFTALLGVLYALGLNYRKRERALELLGCSADQVIRGRDLQWLGRVARRRLPAGPDCGDGLNLAESTGESPASGNGGGFGQAPDGIEIDRGRLCLSAVAPRTDLLDRARQRIQDLTQGSSAQVHPIAPTGWKEGSDGYLPPTDWPGG